MSRHRAGWLSRDPGCPGVDDLSQMSELLVLPTNARLVADRLLKEWHGDIANLLDVLKA